jgi:hypothetical protein
MKFKILNKYKFFVSSGQSLTRQFRDPKNRQLDSNYLHQRTGGSTGTGDLIMPGFTKTYVAIAKPTVTGTEGNISFRMGATRSYKYTIEGESEDRTVYLNA